MTVDQQALVAVHETMQVRLDQTRIALESAKRSVKNLTLFEAQLVEQVEAVKKARAAFGA